MSCIKFKQEHSFNPDLHRRIIDIKHQYLSRSLDSFRVARYTTTNNFQFHLGWGMRETAHVDLADDRAIAIVAANGWVLKSPRNSYQRIYQQPGDLILLDRAVTHHIIWDKFAKKSKQPWLYLFIDIYYRERWSELNRSIQLAQSAISELNSIETIDWIKAGVNF
jgi:hypothetical protein